VISTDTKYTGAGIESPPAVGLCSTGSADQVVLMAPFAAPGDGTGLPVAGTVPSIRLRGLIAAGTTPSGVTVRPSVQTIVRRRFAVVGVPVEHTSTTPGDLPPEDPLS
jgi:hypothetical protein